MSSWRLQLDSAQLLVVDVQPRLLPHIHGHESVLSQCIRMTQAARAMELPTLFSEQNPQALGATVAELRGCAVDAPAVEKMAFSVCGCEPALARLRAAGRPQVLLIGIETHVCVQQTALDLLASGLRPYVLADAVGSRRPDDRALALERMRAAGVIVTTVESALYELMQRAGTDLFRRILPIVR